MDSHINKTIYMTYKENIPNKVFSRWKNFTPSYNINFNLDHDCINFLNNHFGSYFSDLFRKIPSGMYKADLWRLCKLYIHGGAYADVDLVPYINIDNLDKCITFYSCLSKDKSSIFQAFIVSFSKPRNPLFLQFLISFILNEAYKQNNGPTYDMYKCLSYNLNNITILPEVRYNINEIKINIFIGRSHEFTKNINLYYFPNDIHYTVKLHPNPYQDQFKFEINNNILTVTRLDLDYNYIGWCYEHSCDICISCEESIFMFPEHLTDDRDIYSGYITHNNYKILDSRDRNYGRENGWS